MTENIVSLTPKEREHFAAWLEQEANSSRMMVEQLKKLMPFSPLEESLKREVAACLVMAEKLRNIEDQVLSTEDQP